MKALRPGDVLVVDSDAAYLELVTAALTAADHKAVGCRTGQEARNHLEKTAFDVVLCARQLSDETGDDLCAFIKEQPEYSGVAVGLMVSGREEEDWQLMTAESAPAAGQGAQLRKEVPANDLIARSVSMSELLVRVHGLLRQRRYIEEIQNSISTMMRMAEGIEEQDKRARGHCQRLSIMAVQLGAVLGCDDWQLTTLERAGYLHDIGKVCIPGAIMDKSQPLSPREMEIIRDHCVLGEKLCSEVAALRSVMPIIRSHHERADGTGYPDGLYGEQIPVLAQVFSVVDIYDALRMWRPFRPPMNETQAVDIMRQEVGRGFWNRHIFNAFEEHVLPGLDETLDSLHILWPQA